MSDCMTEPDAKACAAVIQIDPQQAMALINRRQSVSQLTEPAPNRQQVEQLIGLALTAPDHQHLHPWRFVCVTAEQREAFGELLAAAMLAEQPDVDERVLNKIRLQPMRAPMIIVCILSYRPSDKISRDEQLLSCGAAVQNILLGLVGLGYASIWRTGAVAQLNYLREALGCKPDDEIVGLVYVGTPVQQPPARIPLPVDEFLTEWHVGS